MLGSRADPLVADGEKGRKAHATLIQFSLFVRMRVGAVWNMLVHTAHILFRKQRISTVAKQVCTGVCHCAGFLAGVRLVFYAYHLFCFG